jgi:crotonobetainyl-CoA:carnitine CoA-transferase CaiB-like acyl-CoA transferase
MKLMSKEEDRAKFRELLLGADIVINRYWPTVLDKHSTGYKDIFKLDKERSRGYIYIYKNCFRWAGPWSYHSG